MYFVMYSTGGPQLAKMVIAKNSGEARMYIQNTVPGAQVLSCMCEDSPEYKELLKNV